MKTLLAILCGLAALAGVGVAVALVSNGLSGTSGAIALASIPLVIALLNLLVLASLLGRGRSWPFAFYLLAGLDVLAAVLAGLFWKSISFQVGDIWTLAAPAMAVLLLKAVLSVMVARNLPQG